MIGGMTHMSAESKNRLKISGGLEDIQKLRYFIALAECSSFTEAAAQLGISQSAVSQQMAELERLIEAPLFIRSNRQCQLTHVGKVLLKEAFFLVAKSDEAFKKVHLAVKGITGQLRIGYWGGIEKTFLPQAIYDFRSVNPEVHFSLHQYNCEELNKALMREDIDIGFSTSYGFDHFPELAAKTLFTDSMCIVIHRSHRLASESYINIADLANEQIVTFHPQADYLSHDHTLQLCVENGFMPQNPLLCQDLATILLTIESGLGVAILPGSIREAAGRGLRMIEAGPHTQHLEIMVAWKNNNFNPSIPAFVDKLESLNPIRSLKINARPPRSHPA